MRHSRSRSRSAGCGNGDAAEALDKPDKAVRYTSLVRSIR